MKLDNSKENEDEMLIDISNVIIDDSDLIVGIEITKFADLLKKILKSEMKDKTILILRDEEVTIILKLLETSPDYFNNIEVSLVEIIKDNKIDTSDIPIIVELIQKLYKLIYKINGIKLDSKKRCEICANILKFLLNVLVEEKIIKIDYENKNAFLLRIYMLIDSFIGLLILPKEMKTKSCIKSIFGKK